MKITYRLIHLKYYFITRVFAWGSKKAHIVIQDTPNEIMCTSSPDTGTLDLRQ